MGVGVTQPPAKLFLFITAIITVETRRHWDHQPLFQGQLFARKIITMKGYKAQSAKGRGARAEVWRKPERWRLGPRVFLGPGHVGALCLVRTQNPHPRKESRWSTYTMVFAQTVKAGEPEHQAGARCESQPKERGSGPPC